MVDYLLQVFKQRLVDTFEQDTYSALCAEDRALIERGLDLALQAPSLVQGTKELMLILDDAADSNLLLSEGAVE